MAGIVLKRRTTGTYVSGAGARLGRRDRTKIVARRIDTLLAEGRQMGFTLDELLDLVRQRDAAMKTNKSEV
jgi:GntR family transcriptional regulator